MYVQLYLGDIDVGFTVIVPDQWDEQEFNERFHYWYDEEEDCIVIQVLAPNGDEIFNESYEVGYIEDEVHDFSDIDDLVEE